MCVVFVVVSFLFFLFDVGLGECQLIQPANGAGRNGFYGVGTNMGLFGWVGMGTACLWVGTGWVYYINGLGWVRMDCKLVVTHADAVTHPGGLTSRVAPPWCPPLPRLLLQT